MSSVQVRSPALERPVPIGAGRCRWTSLADERCIYGETFNVQSGSTDYTKFKPLIEPGNDAAIDTLDDELNHMASVNPNGPAYSYDGPGDDNPLRVPFFADSGALNPSGSLRFEPYDITGYRLRPTVSTTHSPGTPLVSTVLGQQDRLVTDDFDCDGDVDCDDRSLIVIASNEGWTLDDLHDFVRDFNSGYARHCP